MIEGTEREGKDGKEMKGRKGKGKGEGKGKDRKGRERCLVFV